MTNRIDLLAVYLFLIIFYWTPPHFWALALLKQRDYGRAGVPMAPLVWGERETKRQMFWYTLDPAFRSRCCRWRSARSASSIWSPPRRSARNSSSRCCASCARPSGTKPAWRLYKFSLLYLALLFAAMVVDRLVLGISPGRGLIADGLVPFRADVQVRRVLSA